MAQLIHLEDTIVAISSATAPGGIGIVRLSGPQALVIAEGMFITKNKKPVSSFKSFTVHYGYVVNPIDGLPAQIIDEALLTLMRAPKSYTCEDVVEISCHGGVVVLKAIIKLALGLGARLAEPGEFTKRAFLNGRIDLTQAEAVLDMIMAKTESFARVITNQLKGDLTLELEAIREILMNVYTELEALVNFPDDGIDEPAQRAINDLLRQAQSKVEHLLKTSEQGKILKDGIKIVLCGRPNVGKSSLLNALLKQPRAIVSEIAGTTRDTIEETFQMKGIPFQLVDTAGILSPRDTIEQEAVKRSRLSIQGADLVLFMVDGSQPLSAQDEELIALVGGQNTIIIVNKNDLPSRMDIAKLQGRFKNKSIVTISALQKIGMDSLEETILQNIFHGQSLNEQGVLISNLRHVTALQESLFCLQKALQTFSQGISFEFVSEEIKSAVTYLDSITGRDVDQDLLDRIFSEFCIGK